MTTYEDLESTDTYRTVIENAPAGPEWLRGPADSRFTIALDIAFGGPDYRTHGAQSTAIMDALESMTDGYLDALLWTSVMDESAENGGDSSYADEGYSAADVTPEFRARVLDHLLSVVVAHPLAVRLYGARRLLPAGGSFRLGNVTVAQDGGWDYFGHDYLLTRDGHGAGFWDRGLGELGDYLTKIAESNGGSEHADGSLQLTADGQIDA